MVNAEKINPLINPQSLEETASNCRKAIGVLGIMLAASYDCPTSDDEHTGIWLLMSTIEAALKYHEPKKPDAD